MPIYEYKCADCGNRFEKLVRRADDAMESGCPSCGEKHLTQEYSTFAARSEAPQEHCAAPSGGCGGGMCGGMGGGMCHRN